MSDPILADEKGAGVHTNSCPCETGKVLMRVDCLSSKVLENFPGHGITETVHLLCPVNCL